MNGTDRYDWKYCAILLKSGTWLTEMFIVQLASGSQILSVLIPFLLHMEETKKCNILGE